MAEDGRRYAIYFAPRPGSRHDQVGSRWLGRDALSGLRLAQPFVDGLAPGRLDALTAAPRRYGLHATLKPPFRLRDGSDWPRLDAGLCALSAGLKPFSFQVGVAWLDNFLAWRPTTEEPQLAAIAERCAVELDPLRRPPEAVELARRRSAGLTTRQSELLERWGYPYLMEEFRFHLSLSAQIEGNEALHLGAALEAHCRGIAEEPLQFDALSLFVQQEPGADFLQVCRYLFGGQIWRSSHWKTCVAA